MQAQDTQEWNDWEARKAIALEAFRIALEALETIRDADFRGNRSPEAFIAARALERIDRVTSQ